MDSVIDLNEYKMMGAIKCPHCTKGAVFSYGAQGRTSVPCPRCRKMVLWDYDRMIGYKAILKKTTNK